MLAAQAAVARDQREIAGGQQRDDHDQRDDPAVGEELPEAQAHVLSLGQIHRRAVDEAHGAVIVAVEEDLRLAEHRPGLERRFQLLLIDRDEQLAVLRIKVPGQQGRERVLGVERQLPVALGQADLHLLHRLRGAQQLPVGEVVEHPVVERDRVGEVAELLQPGVVVAVAAHDDDQRAHVAALRRGDQAVARGAGVAGLDAGGALEQIALVHVIVRVLADEGVGVVDHLAVVDELGFGLILDGVGHLHEQRVLHGLGRHQVEVVGRAVVILGGQAVGVDKVGVDAAELYGPLVHPVHKGADRAGQIAADHVAGLVGGADHRAVEELAQAQLHARDDAGAAAVLPEALAAVALGGDGVAQAHVAPVDGLQRQQHGHHLGQAGRGAALLGVHRVKEAAGVHIDHQRRLRVQLRRAEGRGRRSGSREQKRQAKHHGEKSEFFHFALPFSTECGIVIVLYGLRKRIAT